MFIIQNTEAAVFIGPFETEAAAYAWLDKHGPHLNPDDFYVWMLNSPEPTQALAAAPQMLDALYTVKFTLESVKPSTTVGELLDLWETTNAAILKAEGR